MFKSSLATNSFVTADAITGKKHMPSTSKTKQQVQGYLFGVIPYDNIKSVFAEGPTIAEYTIWWRGTNSDDAILLGNQNGYHEEYPCWSLLPSFAVSRKFQQIPARAKTMSAQLDTKNMVPGMVRILLVVASWCLWTRPDRGPRSSSGSSSVSNP